MAKGPEPASKFGMALPQLKQIMDKGTRDAPVRAAFGLGKEKSHALLLVEKVGAPRKLSESLTDMFPEAKEVRWGLVFSDPDQSDIAKFRINKPVHGMASKLVKTLKGTGFTEVIFLEDEGDILDRSADKVIGGSKSEGDDEERAGSEAEAEEEAIFAAPRPSQTAAPPLPPGPPPPPPVDAAVLTRALTQLVSQIAELAPGDAELRHTLGQLAAGAGAALKGGDVSRAAHAIADMRKLMPLAPRQNAAPVQTGVALAKSVLLWDAARKHLMGQLQALQHAIIDASSEEADFDEIKAAAPKLEAVLEKLDTRLSERMNAAFTTKDPAEKDKLRREARSVVAEYQAYIANEPLMAVLDSNPFIPFDAAGNVQAALKAIIASL